MFLSWLLDFFLATFFLWPFALLLIALIYKNRKYKKTAYYQITQNPYSSIKYDKGKFGEYLIYKKLQHIEPQGGKFLFNVYVPKTNGGTSEIDVLLICSKGLFVFESKNYGGWIFGNEANKDWTQTFPKGRGRSHKEYFYNPIMQNAAHIRHLKRYLGINIPIHSVIVFSDHCVLMDVTIKSKGVTVLNLRNIPSAIRDIYGRTQKDLLTQAQVNEVYKNLYPHTQVDPFTREQHSHDIRRS